MNNIKILDLFSPEISHTQLQRFQHLAESEIQLITGGLIPNTPNPVLNPFPGATTVGDILARIMPFRPR